MSIILLFFGQWENGPMGQLHDFVVSDLILILNVLNSNILRCIIGIFKHAILCECKKKMKKKWKKVG